MNDCQHASFETRMKYWDKKVPTQEFAGLKLLTDLDFFNK
jgi:hypothetical protein